MDFSYLQAGILGLVQGLTEFIPVSSSGHLILVRDLLHIPDQGSLFDAILHLATLLALIVYFRRDWLKIFKSWFSTKKNDKAAKPYQHLSMLLVVATIPGLIFGYIFHSWVETSLRSVIIVAGLMIVVGIFFIFGEKLLRAKNELHQLNWPKALGVGMAQALAILPGISRSGATILTGMYMGLKREVAARFSFLLSAPIIAAAGGYSLYVSLSEGSFYGWLFSLIAFVVSFLSGLFAINFLLKFLKTHSLNIFAYYLIGVGIILMIMKLV